MQQYLNSSTKSDTENVLDLLDDYARIFDFPVLDNDYMRMADCRLSTFRDNKWLIVFQIIGFNVKASLFYNTVYAYGDIISQSGIYSSLEIFREHPDRPFEDDDGNVLLDPTDFSIILDDVRYDYSLMEEEYVQAGVLPEMQMEPEAKILRWLCHSLPGRFFLDDEELLEILELPPIKPFLQLQKWSHPDIAGNELPSNNKCIQNIALSLIQDDTTLYSCPSEQINTEWFNWLVPPLW